MAAAAAAAGAFFVPAATREEVWKRLNAESGSPAVVPFSYFNRVTRNFAYDALLPTDEFFDGRIFWGWDVFQGRVIPVLVVIRNFATHAEATAARDAILRIDHPNVRRLICYAEPSNSSMDTSKPYTWASATELPPKQHSVATHAPEKAETEGWTATVLKGVQDAIEYLETLGLSAVLAPDTVFLKSGLPDKVYVTRVVPLDRHTVPSTEAQLRGLTSKIADASGISVSYTQCIMAMDADGTLLETAESMFDDDMPTPLIFEQVGNCPIVLREKCLVCRTLVRSAGFHMRGVDCDSPHRHFVCEGCTTKRVEKMLADGQLDLEKLPCTVARCSASLDFDDYASLLHSRLLREWNRLGRAQALKEVEADVNKRLAEIRQKK